MGLEFVRQLSQAGHRVHAVVRDPSRALELEVLTRVAPKRVVVHKADVTSDADIEAFARALGDESVDLLVNNAGMMEHDTTLSVPMSDVLRAFEVNAVAPLRMTRALLPGLGRAGGKVVHISTKMASMSDNQSGGYYAYRMSKAALNMASRSLAVDVAKDGIISVVMHPGWVKTQMGGPGARLEIADAVGTMLETISRLEPSSSGSFLDWRGRPIAW